MPTPTVDRQKLLELYLKDVEEICETCEWVSVMSPQMIINIIADNIEKNFEEVVKNP